MGGASCRELVQQPSSPAGYTVYLFAQDSTTEYDYFPANNLASVSAGYWIAVACPADAGRTN